MFIKYLIKFSPCYRSSTFASRAKAILDMVKDKPANLVTTYALNQNTKNIRTPNPNYVDSIYTSDYSLTSSILTQFVRQKQHITRIIWQVWIQIS